MESSGLDTSKSQVFLYAQRGLPSGQHRLQLLLWCRLQHTERVDNPKSLEDLPVVKTTPMWNTVDRMTAYLLHMVVHDSLEMLTTLPKRSWTHLTPVS